MNSRGLCVHLLEGSTLDLTVIFLPPSTSHHSTSPFPLSGAPQLDFKWHIFRNETAYVSCLVIFNRRFFRSRKNPLKLMTEQMRNGNAIFFTTFRPCDLLEIIDRSRKKCIRVVCCGGGEISKAIRNPFPQIVPVTLSHSARYGPTITAVRFEGSFSFVGLSFPLVASPRAADFQFMQ